MKEVAPYVFNQTLNFGLRQKTNPALTLSTQNNESRTYVFNLNPKFWLRRKLTLDSPYSPQNNEKARTLRFQP
jgi:hypothetical protein